MSTLPPNPITQSARKKITTLAFRQKKVTRRTNYHADRVRLPDRTGA